MSRRTWQRPLGADGRDATRVQVVEAIDRTAPETKEELARTVGISEQYLSELLQELKAADVVHKGYVVDDAALYDNSRHISNLYGTDTSVAEVVSNEEIGDHGTEVLELLDRLESVTTHQYDAARAAFLGESVEHSAKTLESLTNERYSAVLAELKSYTLTTDWPGNRVAADLSTIATNLEIVGDRACFIADVVDREGTDANGIVGERMADIFASGAQINEYFSRILFDCELDVHRQLRNQEETVHRDLDELFELVTAYDPDMYGYLVTVTRALERAIYYWVDAAELAVQIHSGQQPDHVDI
ncbi:PhoU family transcriptional regulator [Natronorubrum halophilum]|uniref:PhoU family transcriptional regulator n=1 Tax=Natronorubrum halophilum TaxID=1702106 RepID=UPI0010C20A8A|nr:PhoU family transcriptional regulator [Natronorubrum halophilum]